MMAISKTARLLMPAQMVPTWKRLQTAPLAGRVVRGAFWCLVGAVGSRILAIAASILIARLLGKTVFGELGIIQSTIALFGTFATFGLGVTATKYVAELRKADPKRAGRIIALSTIVAFVTGLLTAITLAVFSNMIAAGPLRAPNLGGILRLTSLLLLITAVTGAQTGALAGFEAFKRVAFVNALTGLASFPLMLTGVLMGGIFGVVCAMIVVGVINWILNSAALRRVAAVEHVPLALSGWREELPILWTFSIPATLSALLVAPVYWVCNLILIAQPGGYGEMGVFSAANQWKLAILFLPNVLVQLVLPILSNLNAANDFQNQQKLIFANVILNAAVCFVPALVLALLASWTMTAYGSAFVGGAATLRFLAFSAVLSAAIGVIGQFIASSGRMWWGLLLNAVWAACLVTLTILLRGRGATGLAMADFFSYCVHLVTVTAFAIWQFRTLKNRAHETMVGK